MEDKDSLKIAISTNQRQKKNRSNEISIYKEAKDYFEKSFGVNVEIYNIKDFKGDKKAKPGKPAIYIE